MGQAHLQKEQYGKYGWSTGESEGMLWSGCLRFPQNSYVEP